MFCRKVYMIAAVNESVIGEADESKFGKIKYESRKLVKRQLGVWRHRINVLLGMAERRDSKCNQKVSVAGIRNNFELLESP
ncbi:hypothetical protein TNIN_196561 [Trichonephila inaurata madagascariensis]|uniref:Uncharacterized protein n=1 Tax=Trichonephila inaurata madagascariensis TaxID=2747483 RepID=A0A8X6YJ09_9ARAC|nr:hypothetical protein TNIN_196561 [Trichonephila inaurata madagascariensis]